MSKLNAGAEYQNQGLGCEGRGRLEMPVIRILSEFDQGMQMWVAECVE
jgi:hypothetical protein